MKAVLLLVAVPLLSQDGSVVEGTARNRLTQTPVAGVSVKLAAASATDKLLTSAVTNAAGAFRIEGLKEGDYVASFDAPKGFLAPWGVDELCKPFHVAPGSPKRLDIPMRPLGSLRGRVIDPDGGPLGRVRVEVFRVHYAGGDILTTDSEGRFVSEALTPGPYYLRARPVLAGTPLAKKPENVSPLSAQPREGEGWIWAPTYYPGSIEIAGAETIVIHEGDELSGYDIRVRAAPVYRLRGTIRDETGNPAAGVDVWLLSEIGWGTGEARVQSGADGRFEFPAVRPGDWRIVAEVKHDAMKWKGFDRITMPKHDVEDAVVRIAAPFVLDGVVEGTPQDASWKGYVTPFLEPAVGSIEEESNADKRPDGTFRFENVYAGRYRVGLFKRTPGYYRKSILLGARDVTGQEIDLIPNSPALRVVFRPNPPTLRGQVENGAGAEVILIETQQSTFVPGDFLHVAVCDAEGRFSFNDVRPVPYYVFATRIAGNVESDAVAEMVFARSFHLRANTIQPEEGETVTVNLKIIPWPD